MRFGFVLDGNMSYESDGQRQQRIANEKRAIRRENAVIELVDAAERFLANDPDGETKVMDRVDLIRNTRVSHAEAYSAMASEIGDFTSLLEYYEVWSGPPRVGVQLWRGFVVSMAGFVTKAVVDGISISFSLKLTNIGGYVVVIRSGEDRVVVSQCSRDDIRLGNKTFAGLAEGAWEAFCGLLGITGASMPDSFISASTARV